MTPLISTILIFAAIIAALIVCMACGVLVVAEANAPEDAGDDLQDDEFLASLARQSDIMKRMSQ